MSARLVWSRGGEAELASVVGDAIVLRSTVPSPPGSRIEGTFDAAPGSPPLRLRLKVHGCLRGPGGGFSLRGRPLDLTRSDRARLEALARGEGAPSASAERPPAGARDGEEPGGDREDHEQHGTCPLREL